jgi:hypothetical protein
MNKIITKIYVYIYEFVIHSIEIISFIISMIIIVVVICIISMIIVVIHCCYYYYYLSKLGSDMFARPKQCGLKNYL